MPAMPEEQPASFGDSSSFLGGGASSSTYAAAAADYGTGGSLSPVARQDSFTGVTGRTGGCGCLAGHGCGAVEPAGAAARPLGRFHSSRARWR